jgi:hypothetical protein
MERRFRDPDEELPMTPLPFTEIEIGTKPLYRIQSCPDRYWTGAVYGDRQVVMGLMYPKLVAVLFDSEGNLLEVQTRLFSFKAKSMGPNGPYLLGGEEFERKLDVELSSWQSNLGFLEGPISVKPYWLPEYWTGIEDIPQGLREILEDPEEDEEDQRLELEALDDWIREGNFVFWWCENYHLDRDGEGI